MAEIFKIASAIILSLGGSGIVLFGLSSWLGKVWANRILEKEKHQYDIEIENYKAKLETELSKINILYERASYISKAQYDNEIRIYINIWNDMHNCIMNTLSLYKIMEDVPLDEKVKQDFNFKKYSTFVSSYNSFLDTIEKNAPFYKEYLYNDFILIRNKCHELGNIFKKYEIDIPYNMSFTLARDIQMDDETHDKVYDKIPKEINDMKGKLCKDIREYLLSLQIVS
ncbi:MAG: hypothetical protein A2Y17_01385 [Clostridiales bacterium GWF2_38_85]|nr:MAG: hypothetical protein A2Y17_01385 [Clostridiales bacterium GWF2_38_85]HBL85173.1 hypothetical protein [Clostridiales bacterium]